MSFKTYFSVSPQEFLTDNTTHKILDKVAREASKQKESVLLEQLGDLVKKRLLVIEETEPMLVKTSISEDSQDFKFEMVQSFRLVLKDQEYVEQLEDKIQGLEQQVELLHKKLNNVKKLLVELNETELE